MQLIRFSDTFLLADTRRSFDLVRALESRSCELNLTSNGDGTAVNRTDGGQQLGVRNLRPSRETERNGITEHQVGDELVTCPEARGLIAELSQRVHECMREASVVLMC